MEGCFSEVRRGYGVILLLPDSSSIVAQFWCKKGSTLGTERGYFDDRVLLKRAIEEVCPQAFSHIYRKYISFVAKYIAHKVPSEDEGRDLAHDVFLRLLQGSCRYLGETDVQGYLCGLAQNVLKEHFRSIRNRLRISSAEIKIAGDLLTTRRQTEYPLGILEKAEILQIIWEKAVNLPDKSRQAVELVYVEGLPVPQAASKAGCTLKVFQYRLYHGINLLSKTLDSRRKKR